MEWFRREGSYEDDGGFVGFSQPDHRTMMICSGRCEGGNRRLCSCLLRYSLQPSLLSLLSLLVLFFYLKVSMMYSLWSKWQRGWLGFERVYDRSEEVFRRFLVFLRLLRVRSVVMGDGWLGWEGEREGGGEEGSGALPIEVHVQVCAVLFCVCELKKKTYRTVDGEGSM